MQEAIFNSVASNRDKVADSLLSISQNILVITLGLLPILFIPSSVATFSYSKILFVICGVALGLIFFALSTLREGSFTLRFSPTLLALWGLAAVTMIAALFSGDFVDSFIGESFGVHSAAFMLLLASVASAVTILKHSKSSVIRLYTLITVSAMVLGLWHLARLLFGAESLSLGVFTNQVSSLIGSWNDVGLFFGLSVLLSLVAVEQLPLTKWGKIILSAVTGLALIMLAVVNFFAVWLVLGVVSLAVLMYALTKSRFKEATLGVETADNSSVISISLSAVVFVASLLFVIGGSALGGVVSNVTGISYVEVRPSFTATVDVARSVYEENAFVGIGPNKFVDAWRLYKDPAINQTVFWNTDFESGSGYITTAMVTTGLFGVITWIIFLGLFVWQGARLLFKAGHSDRFWYFIGTSSFVAAAYLWGMSIIYVPTAAVLILAAVCTGILCAAQSAINPSRSIEVSMLQNRRVGFALVAVVMLVIVSSVSLTYFTGRHYAAVYSFNEARASVAAGTTLDEVERAVVSSFQLSGSDRFAREIAEYQLARLGALANLVEPTEEQRQQFQQALANGINAGQLAAEKDPSEARNWQVLGQIYSVLIPVGIEGSYERAIESFMKARELDPMNPVLSLLLAQANSRNGQLEQARNDAEAAIALKRDYTEAFIFLSQLDIAEGNVDQAIARTQSIISLEPRNPARYYQLGVLVSASGNTEAAVAAFRRAVAIDPDYANARYLLALGLFELDDEAGALEQLQKVLELNPGNQEVQALITALENGELVSPEAATVVSEPESVTDVDEAVTTTQNPDTDLVSPVNVVPDEVINENELIEAE